MKTMKLAGQQIIRTALIASMLLMRAAFERGAAEKFE